MSFEIIHINYEVYDTQFGKTLVASCEKGVCFVAFGKSEDAHIDLLKLFPKENSIRQATNAHQQAIQYIKSLGETPCPPLYLKGTNFQKQVWYTLLQIPKGHIVSYQFIAECIGNPKAVRAVANAIANNPVSYLVPCHRIIRSNGNLGGYRWGIDAKLKMLKTEAVDFTKS